MLTMSSCKSGEFRFNSSSMQKFAGPAWRLFGHLANHAHLEKWARQDRWLAVLFHHITDGSKWRSDDPLIRGLNVDISFDAFKHRIRWLMERYEIISLNSVIAQKPLRKNRPRLLICFDDGYASVFELAAPILQDLGLPWCFFINPGFIGNTALPVDNIVAYVANVHGTEPLSDLARRPIKSARDFIGNYLSQMTPAERRKTVEALAAKLGIDTSALARAGRLFVDKSLIGVLSSCGVEIGNHTFDHVHCRTLDLNAASDQIEASAREIAKMSGRPVRAFAYPYGTVVDATPVVRQAVKSAGHDCAFVVHNRTNSNRTDRFALYRVDVGEMDDAQAALELEVLPRMRGAFAEIRSAIGA